MFQYNNGGFTINSPSVPMTDRIDTGGFASPTTLNQPPLPQQHHHTSHNPFVAGVPADLAPVRRPLPTGQNYGGPPTPFSRMTVHQTERNRTESDIAAGDQIRSTEREYIFGCSSDDDDRRRRRYTADEEPHPEWIAVGNAHLPTTDSAAGSYWPRQPEPRQSASASALLPQSPHLYSKPSGCRVDALPTSRTTTEFSMTGHALHAQAPSSSSILPYRSTQREARQPRTRPSLRNETIAECSDASTPLARLSMATPRLRQAALWTMDGAATDDVPPPARDPSSGFSVRHSYPASASSSSLVYQPNDVWPPLQQQQHRRPTALSTSFDGSPSAIPLLPTTTYDRLAEGATPSGAIGRHGNADRLPQLAVVVDDDDGRVLDSSLPVSMVSQSRPAKDDARRRGDRASAATMATTPCGPPPPPPPIRSTDNSAPLAGYRSPLRAMTVRANADMSNTLPDVRCDRPLTSRTASLTSCNADQRSANDRPAAARGVTPVSGSSGVDDVGRGAATDSGVASGRQRRNVRSRTVGLPEDADDLSGGLAATAFVAGVSLVLGALAVQLLLRLTAMTTPVESEQYGGASASFGVKSQTTSFLSDDDPQVRTVVRDVAVGLAAIVVAVDLCCVLAASFQCYLVIQLTRLSNGRSRAVVFINRCRVSRLLSAAGFLLSIPLFLLALLLHAVLEYEFTPAVVCIAVYVTGVLCVTITAVQSIHHWRRSAAGRCATDTGKRSFTSATPIVTDTSSKAANLSTLV